MGDLAGGAGFPQVAPDQTPKSCGSHCESHADRTADRMRTAVENTRLAVVLLGVSLSASYLGSISVWFRVLAIACLIAGLAFAITAWPTTR